MVIGLAIGFMMLLIVNVFFSFYLLESSTAISLGCGVIVTIVSIGLTYLGVLNDLRFESDMYGTWTILALYGISSIMSWEIVYQIISKINAR